jgi:hypothetical protein
VPFVKAGFVHCFGSASILYVLMMTFLKMTYILEHILEPAHFIPEKRRLHFPPKRRYLPAILNDVTTQKFTIVIAGTMEIRTIVS